MPLPTSAPQLFENSTEHRIVALVEHAGTIYLATEREVFVLRNGVLEQLKFVRAPAQLAATTLDDEIPF